jgi:cytochrome d ubiquinol oxidase subunit II
MLFVMHGAVYMMMKSDDELRMRMRSWASRAWISFVLIYICASIVAIAKSPFLFKGALGNPFFWVFFVLMLASLITIPLALKAGRAGRAFIGTTCSIVSIMGLTAASLFPRLVPSSINLDYSLTITNASSSQTTLTTMLVIALIGMPVVIAYTVVIYRIFKGKVVIGEDSY